MPEELLILTGLQRIKDGLLDPKTLSKEDRLPYIEVLFSEEYTEMQIAEIMKVSEKTIQRDIKDIREKNSLSPDVIQAKQIIGDFFKKALLHHGRLVRLSREKGTSDENKIQAEFLAWRILKEMIAAMQSLGYLPLKPQEIVGDLFHHIDDQNLEKSFQDIRKSLSDVIDVAQQCGTLTPELQENVNSLQQRVEKAEIVQQVEKLSKHPNEIKEENHDQQNS